MQIFSCLKSSAGVNGLQLLCFNVLGPRDNIFFTTYFRPQRQYTGWLGRLMIGHEGRLASSKTFDDVVDDVGVDDVDVDDVDDDNECAGREGCVLWIVTMMKMLLIECDDGN